MVLAFLHPDTRAALSSATNPATDDARLMPPIRFSPRVLVAVSTSALALAAFLVVQFGTPAPPSFPAADYTAVAEQPSTRPLVGTSYTHRAFEGCEGRNTGILDSYHRPGVAEAVHRQLADMRADGVQSLRIIVWHMRTVVRQEWGVVPARGGRLARPYRGNLSAFAAEVRRFGFQRLTIAFSPQWRNSPLRENFDPGLFEENWGVVRDVRELALAHGPAEVRFDLLTEGAPSGYLPGPIRARLGAYVQRIYTRYVGAFGHHDVTVSAIAPRHPEDRGDRLGHLIDLIEDAGAPLPTWFEIHVNYDAAGVRHGLRYADSVLTARDLDQPLVIGETAYDDRSVARAIGDWMEHTSRPLDEILQWYLRVESDCQVSPPYQADAYLDLAREHAGGGSHEEATPEPNSEAPSASTSATNSGSASSSTGRAGREPELLMRV
jgi:hypothetical protein